MNQIGLRTAVHRSGREPAPRDTRAGAVAGAMHGPELRGAAALADAAHVTGEEPALRTVSHHWSPDLDPWATQCNAIRVWQCHRWYSLARLWTLCTCRYELFPTAENDSRVGVRIKYELDSLVLSQVPLREFAGQRSFTRGGAGHAWYASLDSAVLARYQTLRKFG